MLPEGLTNYQCRQWNDNFHELSRKMLSFGFTDEVRNVSLLIIN